MSLLSIVIPTRERARYVGASIRTALQATDAPFEVVVADNASVDGTRDVIAAIDDPRLRYERSDIRLSMRDNFERGLALARGDLIAFIGDDDGLLGHAPSTVHRLFEAPEVMAVAAARAHYYWPDLGIGRRNTALLPRGNGVERRNSRAELRSLLDTSDYYRLPCVYHGFVRRSLIDRMRKGRFFLSSQVDIYSAIALSMADVTFAYSHYPLAINGGSARSNGASHFGGGTAEERTKWKQEDDLGFLPGFDNHATVASLIIESALRYVAAFGGSLSDIFSQSAIDTTMAAERLARMQRHLPVDSFEAALVATRSSAGAAAPGRGVGKRLLRLVQSFGVSMPINAEKHDVHDVFSAAELLQKLLAKGWRRNVEYPIEQIRTAARIGRG